MKRRWRKISVEELRHIWDILRRRDEIYNGCTEAELLRIYGSGNIIHKPGYGWYKLTAY